VFPDSSEPNTFFSDLVHLNNTSASNILNSLSRYLHKHGFTQEYLLQNLISFAADGESNMLGRKKVVAAQLVEMFPEVLACQCCNNRLELSVIDVVREINGIEHLKRFFDKTVQIVLGFTNKPI
jgi:hypothetical protein